MIRFKATIVFCVVVLLVSSPATLSQGPQPVPEFLGPALQIPLAHQMPGAAAMRALAAAYPSRITAAQVRLGGWAVRMDDEWYYWADGRLLPADLVTDADQFVGIRFYTYELGPLTKREITPELEQRLREEIDPYEMDTSLRFNGFLDRLYQVDSQAAAEAAMVSVSFLGRWTRVNPLLVEPLARVEQEVRRIAAADPELRTWVDGLASVQGYNWRNISGTLRRSYHSYGVAVDLTPTYYQRTWPYWRWAAESGVEWWNLPLQERWLVPDPIVAAFEAHGFVWGGKWLFFDGLHFEYRPETILMATDFR